jgi:hypothetical protein
MTDKEALAKLALPALIGAAIWRVVKCALRTYVGLCILRLLGVHI